MDNQFILFASALTLITVLGLSHKFNPSINSKEYDESKKKDVIESRIENFENIAQGSMSGFGFQKAVDSYPLFTNFYVKQLGADFNLNSIIKKLRMITNQPTVQNGLQRGLFTGSNQVNMGQYKCPIIIVPDIGASRIYAKWSKSSGQTVKKTDAYGNFTTDEKWACKDTQTSFVPIWFPDQTTGLNQKCWSDNTKVHLSTNGDVVNTQGLTSTTLGLESLDFDTDIYGTLIKAFQALGYVNGVTLYGASYDFRTICTIDVIADFAKSLTNLIEKSVNMNGRKAILVCHGLGAVLMNFLLVNSEKEWKDQYIESFIMISATFGGTPKASRVLLSGETLPSKQEQQLIRDTTLNFTGLQWMLPMPQVYGQRDIVYYRQVSYKAGKIPELLSIASNIINGSNESSDIYTQVVSPIAEKSLEAPQVLTYILGGVNVPTELNYYYEDILNDPVKNYGSDAENGDGTVPKFALEYPLKWTKTQKEPIHFRFYKGAEHSKIMAMVDPVTDILEIIKQLNNVYQ